MMDEKSIKTLEFDRVTAALADQAASSLGRELALGLVPSPDRSVVTARLVQTAEAFAVIHRGDRPPFGGVADIRQELHRAGRGGTLNGQELLAAAEFIKAAAALRSFLSQRQSTCLGLSALARGMAVPEDVATAIRRAITEDGEVADDASPKLARLRRGLKVLGERIRDRMHGYLRGPESLKALQEPIITIREGRYVLPVRQDSRHVIPGVVHDVSSSGATAFVEPIACVPLNNELRRMQVEEEEEVRRVLAALSATLGAVAGEALVMVDVVAELDFAFAKARLALVQRAERPRLTDEVRFDYPAARHPLIDPELVVPVDVRLGGDFSVLVITGPNTGGKTVTLKTAGLLGLMVQSGLFIPAGPNPEATVFDEILADIGDEQSIEQSLSTFSSHMRNIVRMLELSGPRSLVLFDEIGAGTDPTEGAALATAMLEELHDRGSRTIATTHYGQLKEFAYSHAGVANASVSFDPESLAPTYRLNIGVPGPSNALAIAGRLGLASSIVSRAKDLVGEDRVQVEEMIQRLLVERAGLEADRAELARLRRETAAAKLEYDSRMAEQHRQYEAALAKVRGELRQVVSRARKDFDELTREVRSLTTLPDSRSIERSITQLRERWRAVRHEAEVVVGADEVTVAQGTGLATKSVRPGLKVLVHRLGQTGRVLTVPDAGGQVAVQVGIIRVMAELADLSEAPEAPEDDHYVGGGSIAGLGKGARAPGGKAAMAGGVAKTQAFSTELDLRGLTVEEALLRLDKYLDDAMLAGAKRVRVIHGKGTGALREAVTSHLRQSPHVSLHYFAALNEGGDGVTVIELG